jgi:hypothetical protein
VSAMIPASSMRLMKKMSLKKKGLFIFTQDHLLQDY